jgi:hypothetical protein
MDSAKPGRVYAIDLSSKRVIGAVRTGRLPNYGIASMHGYGGVTNLLDDTIALYDERTGRLIETIGTGRSSFPVGLAPALYGERTLWGAALFGNGRTDAVRAFDQATTRAVGGKGLASGVDGGGPVDICLSPRDVMAVSLFMGNEVRFYAIPSGRLLGKVRVPRPGMGDFSPDGRFFYVPSFAGFLCEINTDDYRARWIPVGPNPVRALYRPSGTAASGGASGMADRQAAPSYDAPGAEHFTDAKSPTDSFNAFLGRD